MKTENIFGWCSKCAAVWSTIHRILEISQPCCVCWNCGVSSKYRTVIQPKIEFKPIKFQSGGNCRCSSNLLRPSEIRQLLR